MARFRIPFAVKFAASAALLSMVAMALFAYLSFSLHSGMILQAIQEELAATVRNSAASFSVPDVRASTADQFAEVSAKLRKLDDINPKADYFRLINVAGREPILVGSSVPESPQSDGIGKPYNPPSLVRTEITQCVVKNTTCVTPLYRRGSKLWVSAEAPVLDARGRVVGVLSADREAAEYSSAVNAALVRSAYYSIVALAVSIAAGFFLSARITRPLRHLYDASTAAREGRFRPVPVTGTDEVATLTRDFNETNRVLQEKIEELANLNRELERRVENRTEELQSSLEEVRERQDILQREISVARLVQATIIPQSLRRERLSIHVAYVPILGIGGDLGLILERDSSHFDASVGDVTGHGLGAALVVNRVHTLMEELYTAAAPLDAIIHRLDYFLAEEVADIGMFLTFFACRFDLERMKMEYTGGGHVPALHIRPSNGRVTVLESRCGILGVGDPYCDDPPVASIDLEKGDCVVMYTDGLVEAYSGEGKPFGQKRLEETLASAARPGEGSEKIAAALVEAVKTFTGGYFQDDVLVLAAHVE